MGAFTRAWICFSIALMLTILVITGELRFYINPRLQLFTIFGIVVLLLLGMVQLWNLRVPPQHSTGAIGYLLLLSPFLIFLLIRPGALDASMAAHKGGIYVPSKSLGREQHVLNREGATARKEGKSLNQGNSDSPSTKKETDSTTTKPSASTGEENSYYAKILQDLVSSPMITLGEQTYLDRLTTIEVHHNRELKGKKIRVHGFVYRTRDLPNGVILVSRYAITCCVADASVIGIAATFPGADQVKDGTWIEVEGTLQSRELQHHATPLVNANSFKPIPTPKDPYIYANY
ncbi:putative repeat protein (TIGR03943 family) [Kroppenstedtia sanguinis]|uniref:TIGR03943 family putative permease subunit n=1 Tax=Kroppenstedtia sanguinis TaxID=1380684 RepID=A0ABW4CA57_9BACL